MCETSSHLLRPAACIAALLVSFAVLAVTFAMLCFLRPACACVCVC